MADKQHKGGGSRKWDRSPKRAVNKRERYRKEQRREKHKLKRVLQSSGLVAAEKYADEKILFSYLRKLLNK